MDSDFYAEQSRQITQYPEPKEKKQMQIQIVTTSVETKPTKSGSYEQLEVVFKNLTYQGKVESKKIMSFALPDAFKALKGAPSGAVFDVTVVKNDKGYNDWTTVVPSSGASAATGDSSAPAKSNASPRSTYETPEERAQRQVLIVRQSSVDRALAYHSIGAKAPPKLDEVFETAQAIADFVFQVKSTGPSGFEDLPDFDVAVV